MLSLFLYPLQHRLLGRLFIRGKLDSLIEYALLLLLLRNNDLSVLNAAKIMSCSIVIDLRLWVPTLNS